MHNVGIGQAADDGGSGLGSERDGLDPVVGVEQALHLMGCMWRKQEAGTALACFACGSAIG